MEHKTVNRKDEGRGFLHAGRAQVTAGINYMYKDTYQRIIQEEVNKQSRNYKARHGAHILAFNDIYCCS